jgi:hypothetical protein
MFLFIKKTIICQQNYFSYYLIYRTIINTIASDTIQFIVIVIVAIITNIKLWNILMFRINITIRYKSHYLNNIFSMHNRTCRFFATIEKLINNIILNVMTSMLYSVAAQKTVFFTHGHLIINLWRIFD